MRAANSATIALLATGEYVRAELWTITLNGGTVIRWHNADVNAPIRYGGNSWAKGPPLRRNGIDEKRGVDVATCQVEITALAGTDTMLGVPIIPFIAAHGLDNASVKIERAYAPDWHTMFSPGGPTGTSIRFAGKVTSIDSIQGAVAELTISSWLVLLNADMPRNLYQAACMHTLYDSGCTVNPASFNQSTTVSGGATNYSFSTAATLIDPTFYALGRVVFTSGANNGQSRTVKSGTVSSLILTSPLPAVPAAGDAFTVYAGCDLTRGANGCTKFANLVNYKGTDFVPIPTTPLTIPSSSTTTTSGKGGE